MNLFEKIDSAMEIVRDGWCTPHKAHLLAGSIVALRPETIVEIGVWGGRSLVPMAITCREINHGLVIGIDPWSKEASIEGMTGDDLKWWNEVPHEQVYNNFCDHLDRFDLRHWVEIRRKKSDEVTPPESIGILSLDGNHSEQAIRDTNRYASKIVKGGLCFLDDLEWRGGAVSRAARRLEELGFEKLLHIDTGAVFKRL